MNKRASTEGSGIGIGLGFLKEPNPNAMYDRPNKRKPTIGPCQVLLAFQYVYLQWDERPESVREAFLELVQGQDVPVAPVEMPGSCQGNDPIRHGTAAGTILTAEGQ